jgi:uncharacterized protein YgiM (DUF1202 family)
MVSFGKSRKRISKKNTVPLKLRKLCKKLKIKISRRTSSGKRVYKSVKQLRKEVRSKRKPGSRFIQKANKQSKKKGTQGSFRRWCKSKGLTKNGKVTLKCINKASKSKSALLRKRANFARNIKAYTR